MQRQIAKITRNVKDARMLFGLAVLYVVAGCGTVNVPMQVQHPAEINMKSYKQLAFSGSDGNIGGDVLDAIKNQIVESGRFEVVERDRLDKVLRELKLSQSDLVDEKKRAGLGKIFGVAALIVGRVNGKYDEKRTYNNTTCRDYQTKRDYSCTAYTTTGTYITGGSIDVIDVQTGRIIKSKSMADSCKEALVSYEGYPAVDMNALTGSCISGLVTSFVKAITPWTETVYAAFETDKNIQDLARGVNQVSVGNMKEALAIFSSAAKDAEGNPQVKPSGIAKAYWNMGLVYEYTGEFDKAIDRFKKAYSLSPKGSYLNEINNVSKLRENRKKLKEQGVL